MEPNREQSPNLEECLKLLKGERDEQRLAGLLLVTKFCKADDHSSLCRVSDAVGPIFLDRLLRTGMGRGTISSGGGNNRDAYLSLAVTVLSTFCRVPEIASSEDMVVKIPLILEVMSTHSGSSVLEECFEFLYLVSTASENGLMRFYESKGIKILASQMSSLQDGSHLVEISVKLLQLILRRISLDTIQNNYLAELSVIVAVIARQFAVLHNSLKFEALHLLNAILSSKDSSQLRDALQLLPLDSWSHNIRVGVMAILQNRVGNLLDESTFTQLIQQLNETVAVILEYLEDAKERGQKKGDDLLASVRIIGSYLAEAPLACKEKVQDLLGYMLSVEGEDEQRPFYSVCFLLPMLCQITMKVEGCKALASCGELKAVLDCLSNLIGSNGYTVEDSSSIFLACDTIMNLLLKKDKVQLTLDGSVFVDLLKALACWSENTDDIRRGSSKPS